jgi:predicted enzyme related to lactoylglutathione lyase
MSRDGAQWTDSDGTRHTVNSTDDPQAPGGFYHSQSSPNGDKATAVYNNDYTMADVAANKDWK